MCSVKMPQGARTSGPLKEYIKALEDQLEMYKMIFDSIHHGCIVTDSRGYITHFNKRYGEFLGIDPEQQIGKHCTEVIENTRMHLVAQSGQAEINHPHRIKGQDMVVQRIPIKKNGKVIAVFGQVMFKNVRDVEALAERLNYLESRVKLYEEELISLRSTRYTFDSIIGESPALRRLKAVALKAAKTRYPVLITGESGTGKDLFAQAIHNASARRSYPFVKINCAAIPKDLLESELFGYEKGAFTGASPTGKPGKFELAHRGTVFLDEIGDMPLEMQAKLLRVLEDKEFERIGGTRVIRSDFRLIAATNQDLNSLISVGKFRKDLFYRLNVISLHLPPLKERREDIIPLARYFLRGAARDSGLMDIYMDKDFENAIHAYDWPGNVRELINVIEGAVASLEGDHLKLSHLPLHIGPRDAIPTQLTAKGLKQAQWEAEKQAIMQALRLSCYNKAKAARILGIHRTLLYKKMKKHGIPISDSTAG